MSLIVCPVWRPRIGLKLDQVSVIKSQFQMEFEIV